MLAIAVSIFVHLLQVSATGTVVGTVRLPNGADPAEPARVVLLPPKYTEAWNKQVQQRLDNYWEMFKPEIYANKTQFAELNRVAHLEAMNSVVSTMQREMGPGASPFIKQASPTGQFEFRGIPFGSYQLLVEAPVGGKDVVWSRPVDVRSDLPLFVDLGKPVS